MTSKPFDPTKPVQTRDGRPARIVATDYKAHSPAFCIIAIVPPKDNPQIELIQLFTKEGTAVAGANWDLINIPEKRTLWINVYQRKTDNFYCTSTFLKKYEWQHDKNENYCSTFYTLIASFSREYTEGEGIE